MAVFIFGGRLRGMLEGVRKATCFPAHRKTRTSAKRFARPDKFEQWLMTVHLMWFGSTQEEQP